MFLFTKRETAIFPRWSRRALAPMTALLLGILPACNDGSVDPDKGDGEGGEGGEASLVSSYVTTPVPAAYAGYFDPPVGAGYADEYNVVGSTKPPSWSWGKI